ncbi:MAG: hypothetical protein OEY86_20275 [Nitrospira sp.]|nr:hypothetical protein [Nitrospira sp.]
MCIMLRAIIVTMLWFVGAEPPTVKAQQVGTRLDPDLQAAIKKSYPGAIVATKYQNDPCPAPENHPGWVKADFNGDGLADHAVLLSIENKSGIGMGKRYDSVLVVFERGKSGSYHSVLVDMINENFIRLKNMNMEVTETLIRKQLPGQIKGLGSDGQSTINLAHPGIMMEQCEKWNRLWYWDVKEKRYKDLYDEDYENGKE